MKSVSSRPRVVLVNRCIIENYAKKILLVKRSEGDSWQAGKWECPGGKLDEGQDISHALEREVLEETGLTIIISSRICYVDGEILTSGKYKGFPYVVIFGKAKLVGGKIILSTEHSSYKWVTLSEAYKMDLTQETRKALSSLK